MPSKPLSPEQKRDAERLKAAFKLWQSARRESGKPWTQDEIAEEFGFGQSALSQYINGTIPLNAKALAVFCRVIGVEAHNISPAIVAQQAALAGDLGSQSRPFTSPEKRQTLAAA